MNRREALTGSAALAAAALLPGAASAKATWKAEFVAEFSKQVDHKSASPEQIAQWIDCEAETAWEYRFDECGAIDPVEAALSTADAIRDLC